MKNTFRLKRALITISSVILLTAAAGCKNSSDNNIHENISGQNTADATDNKAADRNASSVEGNTASAESNTAANESKPSAPESKPTATESGLAPENGSPAVTPTSAPVKKPAPCSHNYILSVPAAADCVHSGVNRYTCSKCGVYYEEAVPATGHNYNQGSVKTAATDYSAGIKIFTCSKCKHSYEERYALPHIVDLGGGHTATVYGYWDTSVSDEMLRLLNEYRVQNGLNTLSRNNALDDTSRKRALECAVKVSHTRPNGGDCFTVYPPYTAVGENIAAGQNDAADVTSAWKSSPAHNTNMLTARYTCAATSLFIVVGADGQGYGTYFAQCFMDA